ncbi:MULTISPECIES: tetratricopeptide repeat protein [Alishewanella]|uniref:Tetratricopeptide repeat protein n=1 Tax=Alishewanella jeotgali KCTC 22429 TaxID=1129374 RepID=H3ZA06_9ALTE|nr:MULTISPECIES: tetratricopeptide repeat protein [Alishewanella]EHR42681.1 tetratricopeptide repeat protein [Alishewanella jeotgali KCTC 22429]OCW98280.1 N-acetylglucosaminyl transferase [Alishewanella sp. HH-ZS]
MPELLFLLLPVAAAYGWFMGRNSLKTKELKGRADVTRNLSSGLNFLLTDQEDKAIEQLLELLDIEAATIDTYLALANLFRRKGDWDKAIKIHEKLHQLKLPKNKAQQIQFELAKDYFSAGLFDRAEYLLLPLTDNELLREAVLKQLFSIFLATHEPQKAVALQPAVEKTQSRSLRIMLANMQIQHLEKSQQLDLNRLQQLAEHFPQAIRPRVALARQALAEQQPAVAKAAILSVLKQRVQWAAELLPLLQQCQLDATEWQQLLSPLADKHNISACLLLTDHLAEHQSAAAAEQYLLPKLRQQPNIRLFQKLLQLRQQQSALAAEALISVEELVNAYLDSKALYSCRNCGFKTRQPYWLCPSCQQWETVEPIAGIDGR